MTLTFFARTRLPTLAMLALSGCGEAAAVKATVDVDVLPGTYPNLVQVGQTELTVAVLAPGSVQLADLGPLTVTAGATVDLAAPLVSATGEVQLRDVDGDGRPDAVASFALAALRDAGLLGAETRRLAVRAAAANGTTLTGSDRLFDTGVPVLALPSPGGTEGVGTVQVPLFDGGRPGPTAAGRELWLRIWYPAITTPAQPATYFLDTREADRNAASSQLPMNIFDIVHAWSVRDARSALAGSRPTLLFSTGFGVPLTFYSGVAEDLASHGYVVIGLAHPDGSGIVVYPDGTSSTVDPNVLPEESLRTGVVRGWADDLKFVATWLMGGALGAASVDQNARAVLAMVDLTRLGALGHSFGGAAAVWAAAELPALRASANMDGKFWGDVLQHGPVTPVLLMLAEGHAATDPTIEQFASHSGGHVYTAEINGALHNNFSDSGLLIRALSSLDPRVQPVAYLVGAIDPTRALTIQGAYLRAFFEDAWSGKTSALLSGPTAAFPEVTLTPR
jgi:dienelactone hydrolase